MSQRGGSVRSDVRFGQAVFSPMITQGEADVLLAVDATQLSQPGHAEAGRRVVEPGLIDDAALPNKRSLNVTRLPGGVRIYPNRAGPRLFAPLSPAMRPKPIFLHFVWAERHSKE